MADQMFIIAVARLLTRGDNGTVARRCELGQAAVTTLACRAVAVPGCRRKLRIALTVVFARILRVLWHLTGGLISVAASTRVGVEWCPGSMRGVVFGGIRAGIRRRRRRGPLSRGAL